MHATTIKNIIFDLGNVIINIDPNLSAVAMKMLGFKGGFEKNYSLLNQTGLFDSLEKGLISPEQFHSEIKSHLNNNVTTEEIDKAWGAMLLDFPPKRIEMLQDLKNRYRLFLLSNTNTIHYKQYNNDLINQFGFGLNSLFEKAYYSFEMGMRKPYEEIFEKVIEDRRLIPSETLFIDDLKQNIETAKQLGMQVLLIDILRGDDIIDKLKGF